MFPLAPVTATYMAFEGMLIRIQHLLLTVPHFDHVCKSCAWRRGIEY
jgi:hypothetical protein